ncbi:MAG: Asp-tRNA(Asn)/Glu-tRNA(Gln) amidotransferase subunit GatB [Phycisphaeraceae bacterium]|nr:Asp-tRNA(Asn)/Glu-tRNA(Gln) amidotransferase subunit GatB [Phycisphaerales bacterium]MCB9842042.1 Asp-tRNA(Asn)/Glu-tRNA(Gln) amidotransferase subunit GatB [Phycisphaeraceae bacterium]
MSVTAMPDIASVRPIIGLEIHVELATRRKLFADAPNPAHDEFDNADPNTLTDAVVLALPGALPVINRSAIEHSMRVGMALGCQIASVSRWDRKNYFYPDLPKGYQISQYADPVCGPGITNWPINADGSNHTVRIERAHLEEDAGKLLHELPGGGKIDFSIVDLNRAGTPLLEIVTAPDFQSAEQVVNFARFLRNVCRHLRVSHCTMQKGHIRFEPNINCELTLADGSTVRTPITEVKNLNSFRAVQGAIEYELREQPKRWAETGIAFAPGTKTTRGWNDNSMQTTLQREKEEANDYRYFPDPDLLAIEIDAEWQERVRATVKELPHVRTGRWASSYKLDDRECETLIDDPDTADLFDTAINIVGNNHAKTVANLLLQTGMKLAKERGTTAAALGVSAEHIAAIAQMRDAGDIGSGAIEPLFLASIESERGEEPRAAAERQGLIQVRDEGALRAWCRSAIDDPANAPSVADLRAGKQQAIGRLIGAIMKSSAGKADAKAAREMILEMLAE